MSVTIECTRCGAEKPALAAPPFRPGTKLAALGEEIHQKICAGCYREWIEMSVKLVNELRIDTTDPRGQELWLKQMKLFLGLEEGSDPWARFLDKRVSVEVTNGVTVTATLVGVDDEAITLAELDGGVLPEGFVPGGAKGSATIVRSAVRTVSSAV